MNRCFTLSALVAGSVMLLGSCQEIDDNSISVSDDGKVIITASFPENVDSKVAASDGASALELTWEDDDYLTVVSGSVIETFTMVSHEGKVAQFSGNPVEGESFDIYLSSSKDYLTRSYAGQTQTTVSSTDHLEYEAVLKGVSSYQSVAFTDTWAQENDGELLQNGCLLLHFKMPEDAGKLKSVTLTAPSAIFFTTNTADGEKTATLSLALSNADMVSDNVVKAHVMTSMQEASIPAETELTLTVVSNIGTWSKKFTPGASVLQAGKRNVLKLNSENWIVPTGDGSAENPYILRTAAQVNDIRNKIEMGTTKYFAMVNDIDMASVTDWTALQLTSPYTNKIDFNGNDRVISNFTCKTGGYRSFFGVMNGSCYNVTFTNAVVDATDNSNAAAIIAGYGGNNTGDAFADIHDVHVSGTVTGKSMGTAGMVGLAVNTSLCRCSADVTVSVTDNVKGVGGLVGQFYPRYAKATMTINDCWTSGKVTGKQQVGGIIGTTQRDAINQNQDKTYTYMKIAKSEIKNCYSTAEVEGTFCVGGVCGMTSYFGTYAATDPVSNGLTPDNVISCIAWNSKVTATSTTTGNYSSGAVIGYTNIYNTLKDCYRKAGITCSFNVTDLGSIVPVDQPNASATSQLVTGTKNDTDCTYIYNHAFPYHGKTAGSSETVSDVAKRIGWSETVWDLSGNLPVLKR